MRRFSYPLLLSGKLLALAVIFVGGGFLATIVLPISLLFPGERRDRAQYLIHVTFRSYLHALQFFRLIRMEVDGVEKLSECGGRIVISNHPSILDVVILMAFIPKAQCIVKHELWNHPFLGALMQRANYIRNDLEPELLVARCQESLNEGRCLIIFPEGTRTPPGAMPCFHRGFANIATLTKAPIQLVFITCTPPFLFKGDPWWRVPPQIPLFRVVAADCLDADSYFLYGQRSVAARKLVESLEDYYANHMRKERS